MRSNDLLFVLGGFFFPAEHRGTRVGSGRGVSLQ